MEQVVYGIIFVVLVGFVVVTAMQINKSVAICQLVGGIATVDCSNASSTETCVSSCMLKTDDAICTTLGGSMTDQCSVFADPSIGSCCSIKMTEETNQVIMSYLQNTSNITNVTLPTGFGGETGTGSPTLPRYYGKYAYSLWKYGKPLGV